MKTVGIVGSPRIGNTSFLVKEALNILGHEGIDTELVHLKGKEVKPCDGCLRCKKELKCVIQGDDFDALFETMKEADGIILGSPVYFGSATPQMMSLLDRAAYVQRQTREYFSGKIGGPIVVARRAGHNFTLAQLLLWYFINDMIVVGSTYWNIAVAGSAGKHDIEDDKEGIETVRHFAKSMSFVMKKLNS
ncbi:MAG: flavodoxin family protein [Desulfobacterales bacterium]|nr:flavodoxin family protein [Desulfobacterales bacterium]MBL7210792.1 flavodoxin family protein [Desulfobacteraceae bacterium]